MTARVAVPRATSQVTAADLQLRKVYANNKQNTFTTLTVVRSCAQKVEGKVLELLK